MKSTLHHLTSGIGSLRADSSLEVRPVAAGELERFEGLLTGKHYLGCAPPVGDFLRQVVIREGQWVALLVWGPAALKLKDREQWMGWNRALAAERLKLVVQNRRYLLLHERGEEPNLASAALAAACRGLPDQWRERFGYTPLIAESFTDPEAYSGIPQSRDQWVAASGNDRGPQPAPGRLLRAQRAAKTPLAQGTLPPGPAEGAAQSAGPRTCAGGDTGHPWPSSFEPSATPQPDRGVEKGSRSAREKHSLPHRPAAEHRFDGAFVRSAPNLGDRPLCQSAPSPAAGRTGVADQKRRPPLLRSAHLQCLLRSAHADGCASLCRAPERLARRTTRRVAWRTRPRWENDPQHHRHRQPGGCRGRLTGRRGGHGSERKHPTLRDESCPRTAGRHALSGWQDHHRRPLALPKRNRAHHRRKRRRILPANQRQPAHALAARLHPGLRSPPFVQTICGHGRIEERAVSLCAAQPMATDFPYSRAIVKIHSTRIDKKSGRQSSEDRYYLSSQDISERTPEDWINLSRSHWAGVENRNHWRRDASLGEDGTRLHHPVALINLALLRSVNLRLISTEESHDDWLPAFKERLCAHPTLALALLRKKL